jgi:fructose-1,6-bisphosphatase/inositol monophosphatase family enzyme
MEIRTLMPALVGTLLAGTAQATSYSGTGTVALVRSHDADVSADWFQITGVASLGTCPVYNGLVLFVLKDDDRSWRHFAMALSAKRAGATITAWVDDTKLNPGGYCYLQYIQE